MQTEFNLNEQVIVNTGGNNIFATITEKPTSPFYWLRGDGVGCYLCLFDNGTTQYIPANYIKPTIKVNQVHEYGDKLVIHFLAILNQSDKDKAKQLSKVNGDIFGVNTQYELALLKAKVLGGKRYHNKKFGGGIAFRGLTPTGLVQRLNELI